MKNIYISLDKAREEIKKRWSDSELRNRIEKELGNKFMPYFSKFPRGVSFRQICSPDNGFNFFYQCSKYVGVEPIVLEYHDDIFVHFNEEKKGLGRLRLIMKNGEKRTADIMDFHVAEKKILKEIKIKTGENLINFHRNLFKISEYEIEMRDNSKWFHNIGKAKDYYYFFFLHFVAHGVLFETFSTDEREKGEVEFVNSIIMENIEKIKKEFGLAPIIVRSYPENQTNEEDFYWWCYSSSLNNYIIDYVTRNNISLIKTNID